MSTITNTIRKYRACCDYLSQHTDWLEEHSYTAARAAAREALGDEHAELAHDSLTYCDPSINGWSVTIRFFGPDALGLMTEARRKLGGMWQKNAWGSLFELSQDREDYAGIRVELDVERELVCKPVITGQREKVIPAQPAVEEHTVTEEIVEWECPPSLVADDETEVSDPYDENLRVG